MGYTLKSVEEVLARANADPEALNEARHRLGVVLDRASAFPGTLRTGRTGSLATRFQLDPVGDGDGLDVLDRRHYPELGPDGDGVGPRDLITEFQSFLGPLVREVWANAQVRRMRRGVKVLCRAPLANGQDPTVDVALGLTRRGEPGLWIPDDEYDEWDASHPERHVELFTSGSEGRRRTRRRTTRVFKAWSRQFLTTDPKPGVLSSFNAAALVYEAIDYEMPLDEALLVVFEHAVSSLRARRTDDPAGVSGPIKLLHSKDKVIDYLVRGRDALDDALTNDDDAEKVQDALSRLFPDYIDPPASKAAWAAAALTGMGIGATGVVLPGSAGAATGKSLRAYGGGHV